MGAALFNRLVMLGVVEDVFNSVDESQNIPGIFLLSVSGVGAMFFIVRWMVKFQREFTNFYVEENKKLRTRIDTLEAEVQSKDGELIAQNRELLRIETESQRRINELESKVSEHENTIARLNRIIDRRKLEE